MDFAEDAGAFCRIWELDSGEGTDDKKSLSSIGIGRRATINPYLSGYLELGVPLTRPTANLNEHHDSPRLFLSLTGRF